jgi:hypothetical protein
VIVSTDISSGEEDGLEEDLIKDDEEEGDSPLFLEQ